MIYTILVSLVAGITLVTLVALSITHKSELAQSFQLLIGLGLAGVVALLGVSLFQIWQMLRRGTFRSSLTRRLFWVMVSVAVLPGISIYAVSLSFLENTVDSWFSGPLRTLQGGKALAETTLGQIEEEQIRRGRVLADELAELSALQQPIQLERLRQRSGLQDVALFDGESFRELSRANGTLDLHPLERPEATVFRSVHSGVSWRERRFLGEDGIELRQLLLVPSVSLYDKSRFLLVTYALPLEMARLIKGVHGAAEVYRQQEYARPGLERLLLIGLTLALALALFAAILLASFFSDRMAAPLRALVQGVRSVARGNYAPLSLDGHRDDELGQLTQSYNNMTLQLQDQRAKVEAQQGHLQQAKEYLEALLESVNTAVLTLDADLCIHLINRKATEFLGSEREALIGVALDGVGEPDGSVNRFSRACALHIREAGKQAWREQVELMHTGGRRVLQVHGAVINHDGNTEYALVFEDVTQLVHAQKNAAWGEVARRLAHEVKNPLTPIQLSIERLQYRLGERLDEAGRKMLNSTAETVLSQVTAMKDLVNAFSQYAKSPEPVLRPLDLNGLIAEVVGLYSGQAALEVVLGSDLPQVNADRILMNRVLVNLIKNALEATAKNTEPAHIVIRSQANPNGVCVCIEDNGPGFTEAQMARLFEPYATTKPKGSGLGLPIVKQVVEVHHGGIEVCNRDPCGAIIRITLPALPEQKEELLREQDTDR